MILAVNNVDHIIFDPLTMTFACLTLSFAVIHFITVIVSACAGYKMLEFIKCPADCKVFFTHQEGIAPDKLKLIYSFGN